MHAPSRVLISLSNLIHHSYADDTERYDSTTPDKINDLFHTISDCFDDMLNWMTENKLKLNQEKTEAMLIGTKTKSRPFKSQISSSPVASYPCLTPVKSLGVVLDNTLSMKQSTSLS